MICWNSGAVTKAFEDLEEVSSDISDGFYSLMEDYQGIRSRKGSYWDRIAGEWLFEFTHVAYAAYREVIADSVPVGQAGLVPVVPDHHSYQSRVINDISFTAGLRDNVRALLQGADVSSWRFSSDTANVGAGGQARRKVARIAQRIIGAPRAPLVICKPQHRCGRAEWLTALWQWRHWARQDAFDYPIGLSVGIDCGWRLKRCSDTSVGDFTSLVRALLPLYVPAMLLEGFAEYRRCALALAVSRPRAVYTANALHGHLTFKILAAEWAESGTRLLCHQHGGGYGMERIHACEAYETRVSDRFYTLGWTGESQRQTPLPGTAIRGSRQRAATGGSGVLLCCTIYPRVVYRIHYQPMPGTIERMFDETVAFTERVHLEGKLVVRLHHLSWGWNFADILRKRVSGLRIDDLALSGRVSFLRASLVAHNYLGSSWLETMAMNVPTVCFYDPDTYLFRKAAQPLMDRLRAVGILHQSGASAAQHVADVAAAPMGWWMRPEVQDVRNEFVVRYANFSEEWEAKWATEFEAQIEQGC